MLDSSLVNSDGGRNLPQASDSNSNAGTTAESQPSKSSRKGRGQCSQQQGSPVPMSNMFDLLDPDAEDITDQQETPAVTSTAKIRCPPVYVHGKSVADVNKIMSELKQSNYLLRVNKGGIQVMIKSKDDFSAFIKRLRDENVQFYTHGTSDEIPLKIVLSGLPKYDIDELKGELNINSIVPTEVKLLYSSKMGETALYLLMFPKGSVKLQELRKTKSLFNVIIGWRHYIRNKTEAVQCFRCQQFGHGMKNCNLQPKCVKCGEFHLTRECQLPAKSQIHTQGSGENTKANIRCANCSKNHTASYRGCPSRLLYIKNLEEKKSATGRNKEFNKSAGGNRASLGVQQRLCNPNPLIRPGLTFAEVSRNAPAKGPSASTQPDGSDKFSLPEFLNLAQEMFTRLSNCQSKAAQFLAISELMIKYVCNG